MGQVDMRDVAHCVQRLPGNLPHRGASGISAGVDQQPGAFDLLAAGRIDPAQEQAKG